MFRKYCIIIVFLSGFFQCIFAQEVSVTKLPFCSSDESEIAPFVKDSLLFFSSNKNVRWMSKTFDQNMNNFYNLFYIEQQRDSSWTKVELFMHEHFSEFNTSSVFFSSNGEMLFTEAQYKERKRALKADQNLNGIYLAKQRGESFGRAQSLPFNSRRNYDTGHPCLSSDGQMLFFTSDKDGGFGKFDLYMAERNNDEWGEAVNLGEIINTSGSEIYPYYHPNGKLFFASDGHEGKGGVDIFYTMKSDYGWSKPIALESINSNADDFSCYISTNEQSGYFASNRNGNDDLFEFRFRYPIFHQPQKQKKDSYKYRFYDQTGGKGDGPLKYVWKFGDGNQSEGDTVIHEYTKPGKYLVQSVLVDTLDNIELFVLNEYYQEVKPLKQVYITAPDTVKVGESITLNAKKSNLEDFNPKAFYWEFPDQIRAKGETIIHIFRKKGKYKIICGCISMDNLNDQMSSYKEIIVSD